MGKTDPFNKALREIGGAGVQQLEVLEPEQIKEASGTFDVSTALSVDGLHLAHSGMLSLEGLLALCLLFVFIEEVGRIPLQISRILFVLLGKPKGGTRPIAAFCESYGFGAGSEKATPR